MWVQAQHRLNVRVPLSLCYYYCPQLSSQPDADVHPPVVYLPSGGGLSVSSPPTLPSLQWSHPMTTLPSSSGSKHVLVAPDLPCLPQQIINRIVTGEYIDFNNLRGTNKATPSYLEGQVIVVQAKELIASWKMIPKGPVFCPVCGSSDQPWSIQSRGLDGLQSLLVAITKKHPWPSRIIYDQPFREESASMAGHLRGK